MKRKTLNLSDREAAALEAFVTQREAHEALASLVGEESLPYSDSATLKALALLGARTARERLLEDGYKKMAASLSDEDEAFAQEAATWAEESWRDE